MHDFNFFSIFLTHQLVGVPVERCLLQHEPVLLPFDTQEAFAFFLPVQPSLVVWLTQLFDRDAPPAHGTIACAQKRLEGTRRTEVLPICPRRSEKVKHERMRESKKFHSLKSERAK